MVNKQFLGKPSLSELQKHFHAALTTNYRKEVCNNNNDYYYYYNDNILQMKWRHSVQFKHHLCLLKSMVLCSKEKKQQNK